VTWMGAPSIKGAGFREALRWYAETHGAERIAAAFRTLPAEIQARLDPAKETLGILPATWYPTDVVHAILDAVLAGSGTRQRADLARAAGRATVEGTLRGFYGAVFGALATPERYARHAQKIWSLYHDNGQLEVVLSRGGAESRITEWPGHHRFICDMHLAAAPVVWESMGMPVTGSTRLECVSTGGKLCRFETQWARPLHHPRA
jgi:hypothetical protein